MDWWWREYHYSIPTLFLTGRNLVVGIWTAISKPFAQWTRKTPAIQKISWFKGGYDELKKVGKELKHQHLLKRFLLSFFFYNMGVQTVMLAATLYGKAELQIPVTNLIIAILLIQLIAIPGAYLISRLSGKIGNIPALIFCVLVWIGICIGGYLIPVGHLNLFYLLAVVVGFVMGGIQSLSRSTYSKLMPVTSDNTSYFSFFDVTEKISIVLGMFAFGLITQITGSQRQSVLALMIFFLLGIGGLWLTKSSKDKLNTAVI